ncbi:hypothetical protein I9Y33_002659 [Clostridium perfringens]|nr:hypothetical protein [Clostridium perfringens]EGT0014764.1 hypothetical protein [Clostridium perfringens]
MNKLTKLMIEFNSSDLGRKNEIISEIINDNLISSTELECILVGFCDCYVNELKDQYTFVSYCLTKDNKLGTSSLDLLTFEETLIDNINISTKPINVCMFTSNIEIHGRYYGLAMLLKAIVENIHSANKLKTSLLLLKIFLEIDEVTLNLLLEDVLISAANYSSPYFENGILMAKNYLNEYEHIINYSNDFKCSVPAIFDSFESFKKLIVLPKLVK